jgi:hypothetical protein
VPTRRALRDDFDTLCSFRGPREKNTPLIVDPDRVLAAPIASENL